MTLSATLALFAAQPTVVYVDCSLADYAGHDGTSTNLALRTIQEGVDAVATNGTVYVLPGTYDSGFGIDNLSNGGNTNRVFIRKKLRLESTDGADVTHIVGKWSSEPKGVGEDAIRCIAVGRDALGTIIKGFTLRGGASRDTASGNVPANHGGAVCAYNGLASGYVVDCVVSNCVATRGGGLAWMSAIRTLFVDNATTGGGGMALRHGNAYACVFIGNTYRSATSPSDTSALAAVDSMGKVVNCTFVGNAYGGIRAGSSYDLAVVNTVSVGDVNDASLRISNHNYALTNCVFGASRISLTEGYAASEKNVNYAGNDIFQIASPFEGDFRPVAGKMCDGTGDPTAASPAWVPEEFRGYDFYGRPFVVDGKVDIGAVAGAVEMQGGFMVFYDNSCPAPVLPTVPVPGYLTGMSVYVGAAEWPRQVYAEPYPALGKTFFAFEQTDSVGTTGLPVRFANYSGGCWFTLPPVGVVFTNRTMWANGVRYVSPGGTDDESCGSSSNAPYRTLAYAVSQTPSTSVLLALPGTYDAGTAFGYGMTNRVYIDKQLLLKSTDGAAATTIVGYKDTSALNGHSLLSIRPAAIQSGTQAAIQGFTLKDGCVAENKDAATGHGGGFAAGGSLNAKGQLIDCVVTNCYGSRAAGAHGCWAQRCSFMGNSASGQSVLRSAYGSSCTFRNNTPAGGYVFAVGSATAYGCSMYEPSLSVLISSSASAFNSVAFCGSGGTFGYSPSGTERNGNFANKASVDGVTITETLFADGENGDFRLRSDSPAVGGVDLSGTSDRVAWAHFTIDDIENRPQLFVDGRPTAGAVQKTVAAVVAQSTDVAGISPAGTQLVEDGDSVTFTAVGSENRQFLGFSVDGELSETVGRTFTWTADANASYTGAVVVASVFNTNWYVNADSSIGNDGNDGWTAATPRRTLAAGVADAVPGDVVHLAKGLYNEGSDTYSTGVIKNSTTPFLAARVVVPEGVTLVGDEGPEDVIIAGRSQTGAAVSITSASAALGASAVRGVFLEKNACLRRVTVTGGATQVASDSAAGGGGTINDDDNYGGGVLGRKWDNCRVEDCILTNNVGGRAAAVANVTAVRCRITANAGTSTGAGGRRAAFYGCYLNDNKKVSLISDCYNFVGNTVGVGNDGTLASFGAEGKIVMNNVIAKGSNIGAATSATKGTFSNNVVVAGVTVYLTNDVSQLPDQTYTADQLLLDANGVPAKTSPLVGYGVVPTPFDALYAADVDLYGVPRVLNANAQDLGAAEYDWRVDYARDLKGSGAGRVAVPFASPAVTETASGVYIPDGRLDVAWGDGVTAIGKHRFNVTVTGNGTLDVYLNGELFDSCASTGAGASAEPQALSFKNDRIMNALAFVYTPGPNDAGGAYVGGLSSNGGVCIIFR